MPILVWAASFGEVRWRGRRVSIPQEAHDELSSRALEVAGLAGEAPTPMLPNYIYGVLQLELKGPHDFLDVYKGEEHLQIRFWKLLLDLDSIHLPFVFFRMLWSVTLPEVTPLVQFMSHRPRGCVVALEHGQPEHLVSQLSESDRTTLEQFGGPPQFALRFPPQHAALLAGGHWEIGCVPDIPQQARGAFKLDWRKLHLRAPDYPSELLMTAKPQLTGEDCRVIADTLRPILRDVHRDGDFDEGDPEADECRRELISLVFTLHTLYEQLGPMHFVKQVRDLQSRASVRSLTQGHDDDSKAVRVSKFNVIWLLRVLLMCDALRSSAGLADVIRRALDLCVPKVLLPSLVSMLDGSGSIVPNGSTIGKLRLLLDGAFMLYNRSLNESNGDDDEGGAAGRAGWVRYLMSDSSTQHNRHFQLTCVLSIRRGDIVRLHQAASNLVHLWRPGT